MLGVLLLGVFEGVLAHGLEGDGLEKARGDDAVGVDVVAGDGDAAAGDLAALEIGRVHFRISLTSVTAPLMAAAATRRSDRRPLVHEPTKATSILAPLMGWPAAKPMCASASRKVGRSASGWASGLGIDWLTPTDMPGLMPHVTTGSMAAPSRRATSSNLAPGSVATLFHHAAARSKASPAGA